MLLQENKIADGLAAILNALKLDNEGNFVQDFGDATDGQSTNDLAQITNQVGDAEGTDLPAAGNLVPGRKLAGE